MQRILLLVTPVVIVAGMSAACAPMPEPPPVEHPPVVSSFEALGAPHVDPALVPLAWSVTDADGDALVCRLDGDSDGIWDHTVDPCPPVGSRNVTPAAGSDTARLEVRDGTHVTAASVTYAIAPDTVAEGLDLVIRPSTPLDADLLAAFEWAAARWERAVVRGLPDLPVTLAAGECGVGSAPFDGVVDDIVVDVSVQPTPGYIALGGPCRFGPDLLPRFGVVQVDPDWIESTRTLGALEELALHELAHVLGVGTIWNFNRALLVGDGTSDQFFVGPRAVAEYSELGGSGGIAVYDVNGIGTGHWDWWAVGAETMTTISDGAPLSSITIASLADLGYAVDLDAADPFELPPPTAGLATRPHDDAVRF